MDDSMSKAAIGARMNGTKKPYNDVSLSEHFSFTPTFSPPTFYPASILDRFIKSIDKLSASEFGSTKHKLLIEELFAFIEDLDSYKADKSTGLESKLLKLIDERGLLGPRHTEKASKSYIRIPGVYPVMGTFRDLSRPLVVYYPPQHEVSLEKTLFSIRSAAHPVRFDSIWRGLTDVWAKDIWNLLAVIDELLVHGSKRSPEGHPYTYPKGEFLSNLHRRGFSFNTEPIWSGSEEKINQFLNTCTSFRSIQTIRNGWSGTYEPESCYIFDLQKDHRQGDDRLCRFMRQIVVPVEQTVGIVSGGKVTITPILWDPHQTYDALRKKTSYHFYPQYLYWDEISESFIGTIKIVSSLTGRTHVDIRCDIYALTSETLPEGIKFETTVQGFINLRIHVPTSEKPMPRPEILEVVKGLDPDEFSKFQSKFRSGHSDVPQLRLTTFKAEDEINFIELVGDSDITGGEHISKALGADNGYGGTSPIFKQRKIMYESEGIISLRWDPEQWLSVVIRAEPGESERESINNPDPMSDRPDSDSVDVNVAIGKTQELLEDCVEQVRYEGDNLTIGLEIELILAKGDNSRSGFRVFEDISTIFGQLPSAKVQSIGNTKPSSFGSVIFGIDEKMKDEMLENGLEKQEILSKLGISIEQKRCIQWRKLVLPKILKSLQKFDNGIRDVVIVSLHIGKKDGYNLQDVKRIAKAILIYGDLFDYTKLICGESFPDQPIHPDFGSSRHNPYSEKFTTSEHIDLIDKATSLSDVTKIMNPEYYDIEDYRFSFSKLKSQGTIVWRQSIPTACTGGIVVFIAGMLAITTAAMKVDDLHFAELAKHNATWDNLTLLLENDKMGITKLSLSRAEGEMPNEERT